MAANFLTNTRGEFLKLKSTSALWLTLFGALFLPAINTMIFIIRFKNMIPKLKPDPWFVFLNMNWKNTASVILPFFVILSINQFLQIEFRNHCWKQVYATPRKYADIFFSKFLVVHFMIILFFLAFNIFLLISAYIITSLHSEYSLFFSEIPWYRVVELTIRIYIGVLTVTAIQFWLSTRFKNPVIALAVGLSLWGAGLILMSWENIIYYPYMYSTLLFFTDLQGNTGDYSKLVLFSLVSFPIALLIGFYNIYFLKEKG